MLTLIKRLGLLYITFVFFFQYSRSLFCITNLFTLKEVGAIDLLKSFGYGIKMDASMAAYSILAVGILYLFQILFPAHFWPNLKLGFVRIIAILFSLLLVINIELYRHWGFPIDHTLFNYVDKSMEMGNFFSIGMILRFLLLLLLHLVFVFFLFKKDENEYVGSLKLIIPLLSFLGLAVIPLRGGLKQIPLNPSHAYFSSVQFYNHCAVNPVWNLIYYLNKSKHQDQNSIRIDSKDEHFFHSIFKDSSSTNFKFLKSTRPNILIVLLESFTQNVINKKFEGIEITEQTNKMIQKGIYFKNAYSNGDRTDKGIVSVLSGYPALAQNSIMMFPNKVPTLPSIVKNVSSLGYKSAFYYGGDINFAGMKAYLLSAGFNTIVDKADFDPTSYNAKWGVHDHILFDYYIDHLSLQDTPFIHCILSLSSHPPYDIPTKDLWTRETEEKQFLNTIHYTDQSLGLLMKELKKSSLWENLLVVLVADHGGRFPGGMSYEAPEKYKILMHLTGGAVSQDSIIESVVLQSNLATTLLHQMNIYDNHYKFCQDVFSQQYQPFAFYAFNNGIGLIENQAIQIYSNDQSKLIRKEGQSQFSAQQIKALNDLILQDFYSR